MTGEVVVAIELPANQTGVPMTYMAGGRQFIAVVAGARDQPAAIYALALPE